MEELTLSPPPDYFIEIPSPPSYVVAVASDGPPPRYHNIPTKLERAFYFITCFVFIIIGIFYICIGSSYLYLTCAEYIPKASICIGMAWLSFAGLWQMFIKTLQTKRDVNIKLYTALVIIFISCIALPNFIALADIYYLNLMNACDMSLFIEIFTASATGLAVILFPIFFFSLCFRLSKLCQS